ncbi:NAD-binding protein [Nonomuraea sp. NPDC051941]|uniref:NAD-binding protein n=1 Tax=Nonomuraea sp. NPDC051941 TaxID=3364373 RepID=UPI0037CC11CB
MPGLVVQQAGEDGRPVEPGEAQPLGRPVPADVGGGYQSIEFASIFRRFGSQVTVFEAAPRILGREDGRAA